jgi:hypothetical protein
MSEKKSVEPHVVKVRIQLCVPKKWTSEQIEDFADTECPCFSMKVIDEECEEFTRTECAENDDFVHVWLYATTSDSEEEGNG